MPLRTLCPIVFFPSSSEFYVATRSVGCSLGESYVPQMPDSKRGKSFPYLSLTSFSTVFSSSNGGAPLPKQSLTTPNNFISFYLA